MFYEYNNFPISKHCPQTINHIHPNLLTDSPQQLQKHDNPTPNKQKTHKKRHSINRKRHQIPSEQFHNLNRHFSSTHSASPRQ